MCAFYVLKMRIYLQIIHAYYNCIFISLCDCADHQNDSWSGYWSKAVGLWLGNCKNWIRLFSACESRKRKYQQANNPRSIVVLCVCYQWSASEVGDTVALYSGTVAWWIMPGLEDVPKPRFEKLWKLYQYKRRRKISAWLFLRKTFLYEQFCLLLNVSNGVLIIFILWHSYFLLLDLVNIWDILKRKRKRKKVVICTYL